MNIPFGEAALQRIEAQPVAALGRLGRVASLAKPASQLLKSGVSVGFFSKHKAFIEPVQHFSLNPAYPVWA
ncbi:MAG: hypothetical protein ACI8TF_003174 [Paracoccaceae bacterium]|jgi:hypothetical protein